MIRQRNCLENLTILSEKLIRMNWESKLKNKFQNLGRKLVIFQNKSKKITHHLLLSAIMVSAFAGCTRNAPPAEIVFDKSISPYHIVKKGDSISSIANRYRMDKMEVVRLNGLKPPYKIVMGQRLLVKPIANLPTGQKLDNGFETPALESGVDPDVQVTPLQPLSTEVPVADQVEYEASEAVGNFQDSPTPLASNAAIPTVPALSSNFIWPVSGKIIKGFKAVKPDSHDGINIRAPQGTPVNGANNGVVAHAGNQVRGFGNLVLIKHNDGFMSVYAHLDEITVKRGDIVSVGQKIGTVGKSGVVKEPQLYFEIRKNKTPVDPLKYLAQ